MARSRFNLSAHRIVALMVLVLAALPMGPAQAGSSFFSWTTRPVKFMKDGTSYFMKMQVSEVGGSSANLGIAIFKTRNPAGVTRATESHFWSFPISPDSVDFNQNNLSSASIDTGNQLGPFGSIDLNFSQNDPLRRSCRGHIRQRNGRVTGTFDFNTNSDFGTVTKRPARGDLFFHDGANCGGGGGSNRCPRQSRNVAGSRETPNFKFLSALRQNGANAASLEIGYSELISDPPGALALHTIDATVPLGNVVITNNLGSATLQGRQGTGISGTANFTATGSTQSGVPTNCRKGREYLAQSRPGTFSGNLAGSFFLGPDRSLADGDKTGTASKLIVRRR